MTLTLPVNVGVRSPFTVSNDLAAAVALVEEALSRVRKARESERSAWQNLRYAHAEMKQSTSRLTECVYQRERYIARGVSARACSQRKRADRLAGKHQEISREIKLLQSRVASLNLDINVAEEKYQAAFLELMCADEEHVLALSMMVDEYAKYSRVLGA